MAIDPSAQVASSARIHPDAEIGPRCVIGEYCVIESDVRLGQGNRLEPYVYLKRFTRLGDENELSAGVVLGTDPFDKAFTGAPSALEIGHRNRIREHWTISRGTKPGSVTRVGDDNYIMGSGHIAHDCQIGNGITIASNTLVAGYVHIGDQAFLSGGVVVHQHSRIGRNTMVAGNCRVNLDLPPFFLYAGHDARPTGLNLVGLRRAGFTTEQVRGLKLAYSLLYQSGLTREASLARLDELPLGTELAAFIRASQRGIARPAL
ncbi:MAG: acyl-ACP--UDP-N-acetylglucosamine O-acyltransferase [Bryobacteraceae bacterium]|nr:acyl-ACP--UDP-N-acetylglucosamine O-acyltransferase [Bryobacteraceae bacterium]